jgi:hypothetical protein
MKNGGIYMETFASIMEMMMVLLFGISWPLNIYKAWKTKSAKGTSILFYSFIWLGYIFALLGKFALIKNNSPAPWYETVHWYVMFFYFLNIAMVSLGIVIYFRNKMLDSKRVAVKAEAAMQH